MKRISFLMSAAAALLLSAAAVSCSESDNATEPQTPVEESEVVTEGKLIIKEINFGGGFKTTEGKTYSWCKGLVLYNNGGKPVTVKNLAIGTVPPGNAHAANNNYNAEGALVYEKEGWVPMIYAIWYQPNEFTVQPYSDLVIAVNGAIDHTQVAPEAFNLGKAEYHAMYDPASPYVNANAYPAPFEGIAQSQYWKAAVFGLGNAWAISVMCPNLVLFQFPEGTDPAAYCADAANAWYDGGKEIPANYCVKVPTAWVIDAVETYRDGYVDDSKKRLPASLDAGYALYNSNKQYSAYRNVDAEATNAIKSNAGLLVEGYDQGVEDNTDPSGIDAQASIVKGAKIVYKDTDNSTNDFHLRKGWSLK